MTIEAAETTATETTAPATDSAASAETTATGANGDSGPSAGDIRAEQAAALAAVRARESGEEPAKGERQRGPDGKFTKAATGANGEEPPAADPKQEKAPEVKDGEKPEDKKAAEPEAPKVEAPNHVPPALKAAWDKLPEDARQTIDKAYRENSALAGRFSNAVRDFVQPYGQVIDKHASWFQANKVHGAQALDNLLSWDIALSQDIGNKLPALAKVHGMSQAEAVQVINRLVEDYKIDAAALPQSMIDPTTGQALDQNAILNWQAQVDGMKRQNQGLSQENAYLRSVLEQMQSETEKARAEYAQAQESQTIGSYITSFQSTVSPEEWEMLRPHIAAEIDRLPDDTPHDQIIPRAAEAARKRLDGFVSAKVTAAEKSRAEQAQKAAAAAKKAGSINIEGRGTTQTPEMSVRETQRAALAAARARNGATA